jgi:hypothetical protein
MLNTITHAEMQYINQMDCNAYTENFNAIIYTENYDDVIDIVDNTEKSSDDEKERSELEFIFEDKGKTIFSYRLPYHYRRLANGKLVKCNGEEV